LNHAGHLSSGLRQQREIQVIPAEGAASAASTPDSDVPERNHPKAAAAAKRTLDILVSAVALIIFTPLLFLIAVLIKIGSPGPVFFRWYVVGRHGKAFVGYKFRSMYTGADELREELNSQNENSGPFFKVKNDPRVTPVGRMLRKFSLDELPQLWSVLKGDMSLVGPRPAQTFEYEQLEEWHKARVGVRPGCTSSWIVSGKTSDFDRMVQIDLDYIAHWSLLLDFRILCRTAIYLLAGRNS
jgi:lipopolysaccharide/colanic/teichoic acid biosynthesis glycosyltransferase